MRHAWTEKLKTRIRPALYRMGHGGKETFTCPICGYQGPFKDKVVRTENLIRKHSKCPRCAAAERHRLMHLVLDGILRDESGKGKSLLHVAPEECLKRRLQEAFGAYHSMDLFRSDVDFQEDLQRLSFDDQSYDVVVVSRVLITPPDLEACLREIRRILKPGGFLVLAEYLPLQVTEEFGEMKGDRSRILGIDLLAKLASRFDDVRLFNSGEFPEEFQLYNLTWKDGRPFDGYPDPVKAEGKGLKDVIAVCSVSP